MKKYYKYIFIFILLILALGGGGEILRRSGIEPMGEVSVNGSDYQLTSALYDGFFNGQQVNLAQLNLFMKKMPKGGDLHHLYAGSIYAETYLRWVSDKNWRIDSCDFTIIQTPQAEARAPLESSAQLDSNKEPLKADCQALTVDQLIHDELLYRQLILAWSTFDFKSHYHEQISPDLDFFRTFDYFLPVIEGNFAEGLNILKERAIVENIDYIETMLNHVEPPIELFFNETERQNFNMRFQNAKSQQELDIILNEITARLAGDARFAAFIKKTANIIKALHEGIDGDDFMMRFQMHVIRNFDPFRVFIQLYSAHALAKQSALVRGVNIVSPEHYPTALRDYTLHMRMYHYLKQGFPNMRHALHAGELTLGLVRPEDLTFHIEEAVYIAGAHRIGHGVDIAREKNALAVLDYMKRNKIAVEINLTSNEFILGVSEQAHPISIYADYGVPIVISTDDSGVSRNNLTHEYILLASRYRPSYATIKEYVYNSIRYAFLTTDEMRLLTKRLDKKFAQFETDMANLYRQFKPARK